MTPALKLTNVGMRFAMNSGGEKGHFQALSQLDLEVNRGDKLGLVGGNGAGKSTLLRIMAGIYPPGSGTIWRAPGLSIALLSLGLGFKNDLTGRENALLAAVLKGMSNPKPKATYRRLVNLQSWDAFMMSRSKVIPQVCERDWVLPRVYCSTPTYYC